MSTSDPLNPTHSFPTDYQAYIGATGNEAIDDNTAITEKSQKQKDTLKASGHSTTRSHLKGVQTPDSPPLEDVNFRTLSNPDAPSDLLRSNPWLAPSFLSSFFAIMTDLLNTEREMHYNEAQIDIMVRSHIYEMAKQSGALAKLLKQNEAREQLVQAISSFVQAGVSAVNFVQVSRSLGTATREIDADIDKQKKEVDRLASQQPQASDSLTTLNPTNSQKLDEAREKLKNMQARRESDIADRARNYDMQAQTLAEVQKQTINGVQSILVSTIKSDSSVKEETQKILDGITQTMSKFGDSSTRQRENAQAMYDKFNDFLKTLIEKINQQAHLKG